jgi:hypothetical protein
VAVANAVQVSGVTRDEKSVSASAGQVDLSGFLGRLSTATAQLTAVAARWSTNDPQGLSVGPISPPSPAQPAVTGTSGDLNSTGTCDFVCWSTPSTTVVSTTATNGQPGVGSSSAPAQAAVTGGTSPALTFNNTASADRTTYYRPFLGLDPTQPLVSVGSGSASISGCGGGGGGSAVGRGYVTSSATNVSACAETATSTVSLFPRPAALPVLKLTLDYATLGCAVNTVAGTRTRTASGTYRLKVDVTNASGNTVSKTFTETSSDSELQSLLTTQVASNRTLGDYVKSWSLGTPSKSTSVTTTASASLPAVLTLVTKPIRNVEPYTTDAATYTADDASGVTVTVGSANCLTMDAR